jgi:putative transcriptional regulator
MTAGLGACADKGGVHAAPHKAHPTQPSFFILSETAYSAADERERWAGMSRAGQRILKDARHARADARGETSVAFVGALFVNVKALRMRLGLSMPEFAARFALSVDTVRDWEHGRVVPDGPAQALLRVIEAEPEVAERVLGGG